MTGTRGANARGLLGALALAWQAGRHLVLAQVAAALVGAVVPVGVAWLTKIALDRVAHPDGVENLVVVGAGLAAVGIVAALLPHADRYLRQEASRRSALVAQDRLFAAAERFVGLARFEDPAFLDQLRLAHQAGGAAPGVVVAGALAMGRGGLTAVSFLGTLLLLSPWLATVVTVAAVPALAAELALSKRWAALLWRIGPAERREIFYQHLLANAQAAKELRLFGVGAHLRERMTAHRRSADAARRSMDRRELRYQAGLGLLAATTAGAALWWTLTAAAQGRLSVGDVALVIASVAGVQMAMSGLVSEMSMAHQQILLFGHYRAVLASEADLPVPLRPRATPPLRRGIEFRDVWFRYAPGHPWSLRGLNLTIPFGQSVALIGRNGAGKSTLVKMLCRLYDPDRGAVLWDGVDLRELDPVALRQRIGVLFQDFMAYDLTAAENIGLGDVERLGDRDRIQAAAQQARIHDALVDLPQGYRTLLSRLFHDVPDAGTQNAPAAEPTLGVTLSGGQWQRLALARAYLRGERDLLILDEPSAGLDAEAEYEVHRGLREFRSGRTSLLVSHRLGTVRDADLLVVLDQGQVVEQGNHSGLLRAGGRYADLFHQQAEGYLESSDLAGRDNRMPLPTSTAG